MKMKRLFAIAMLTACILTACTDPKDKAKAQLMNLYEEVSQNSDEYTDEQWENFLVEYQKTDSLLNLYEYSAEERQEIGKVKGKCAAYVVKAKAAEAKKAIKEATQELKGMVEGFLEGMSEDK